METEKITVMGKCIHSLLCARNDASTVSHLYDGTNIKQNENTSEFKDTETSQMMTMTSETQHLNNTTKFFNETSFYNHRKNQSFKTTVT